MGRGFIALVQTGQADTNESRKFAVGAAGSSPRRRRAVVRWTPKGRRFIVAGSALRCQAFPIRGSEIIRGPKDR